MDMKIHFKQLPQGMEFDRLKRGLDEVLEEDGWLTGSGQGPEGGWIELELEDERVNPKHGIVAVKHYLQNVGMGQETTMEMAGLEVGVYE